ncbi:MAG: hypothetical protein KTR14_08770 [Vampirovibrio sp.]|nr:hypothetical protein [Vampirovibrio sp.]
MHHSNALKTSGRSHRQILRRVRFLLHQNPPSIQARALIQRHGFDGEMLAEAGVPYELLKLLEWGAFI